MIRSGKNGGQSRRAGISRRDFVNGVALTAAGGAMASGNALAALGGMPVPVYPPALTGLRGSQPGSFEVAHALAWEDVRYPAPARQTDRNYDLVVVGGGISGLTAAFFWRQHKGPAARILIIDNHDDFGGHARRNEFTVDGRTLVGYGGSQSLDTPGSYSPTSARLLRDLGIFTGRFHEYFDRDFAARHGLGPGIWFSEAAYGRNVTAPALDLWNAPRAALSADTIARYPLDEAARGALLRLLRSDENYLAAQPADARRDWLLTHSYKQFLLEKARVPEAVYLLFRDNMRGWWGVGWDTVSAMDAVRMELPGTGHLSLTLPPAKGLERDEPYIFHFPDGNASVARALVRTLIPDSIPGSTMEDLVLARADYTQLDRSDSPCRLRLNSTAVSVRHSADERAVDVTYVRQGKVERVRAAHVVMACYNAILPHICPELPKAQREALAYAEKVPLVYISAALRNWRPFAELGMDRISVPQPDLMHTFGLDFPVSMGGLQFPEDPGQPAIIHGAYIPCAPDRNLPPREQHRLGQREIYALSLDDFEARIIAQLEGALGAAGFDAGRDLAALTVNRWPHGYAYEYNELYDPPHYGRDAGPHLLGAQRLGRISIANSDAAAYAFVDGAIDAAYRAVKEQVA